MPNQLQNREGFTFIEVLVAMLIFTIAVLAAVSIVGGAVRATGESKEISKATWLLQNLMADTEAKLEAQGIDKACKEKEEGKFEAPNEKYTWRVSCYQVDFMLSESAAKLMAAQQAGKEAGSEETQENQMLKLILQLASDYFSKATREIHAEVIWTQGTMPRQISATTHFARYDQKVVLPNFGGSTPGGSTP